ncbi:general secretion pathway protein GspE [Pyxidicoccus fallax]|uniref:General secretion pathway protein GspE n=1 Tax=Pyxidicoccus fallax TaxID=394095 RepID=A0A848LP35_9BACT|nr:general secretion pathway protein GspE [Pyxidicoccus fallax]NMO19363.1 general secretion pathway protein GspE [Pyxidicoccus fallax]NPC83300.1 general secretion pathway protein GspE [Pyxidicoccus fallax]
MKKRLGDILLERGVIDALQLHSALAYQRKWGVPLGQVVVDQRFCTARQVLEALAEQLGMQTVDLESEVPDASLTYLIPEKVAEAHRVVPLRLEARGPRDSVLVVAIAAPASLASLDAVQSVSGKSRVVAKLASDAAIRRAIGRMYRGEKDEAAPRRPGMEGFSLPEADDAMPMVLGESMAELTNMEPPAEDTVTADGLPLLSSLEEAVRPAPAPVQAVAAVKPTPPPVLKPTPAPVKLPALTAARPEQVAQVLVYGWGATAAAGLVRVLETGGGLTARVASTEELLAASEAQVVVAPLPSMEALGHRVAAQVLVAGKVPELDLPRAQAVGARGFLAAPVDPDLLLRAVRRLAKPTDGTVLKRAG